MDFLKQLRKTAQNAARERLEKIGVNVPQSNILDDEDTETRDLIDIYREISERHREPEPIPINAALRDRIKDEITPMCGENHVLLESLNVWLSEHQDASYDHIKQEALQMLQQGGVVCSFGETAEQWIENLQNIAKAQHRTIFNLLLQMHKQCDLESLETWITDMNDRLCAFDMTLDRIDLQRMTLIDC